MDDVLLILLGIAWAIGTPILAIVALVRTSRLRTQNERLAADLAAIRRQMAEGAALPPPFEAPAAEYASRAPGAQRPAYPAEFRFPRPEFRSLTRAEYSARTAGAQ